MGTRVELKHLTQGNKLAGSEHTPYLIGNLHMQTPYLITVHKATTGIGMTVGKGNVGFYVEDRRAVHQIGTTHINNRSRIAIIIHPVEPNRRQPQGIGTERRTAGKHTYLPVATKQRRTHQRACGTVRIG